ARRGGGRAGGLAMVRSAAATGDADPGAGDEYHAERHTTNRPEGVVRHLRAARPRFPRPDGVLGAHGLRPGGRPGDRPADGRVAGRAARPPGAVPGRVSAARLSARLAARAGADP